MHYDKYEKWKQKRQKRHVVKEDIFTVIRERYERQFAKSQSFVLPDSLIRTFPEYEKVGKSLQVFISQFHHVITEFFEDERIGLSPPWLELYYILSHFFFEYLLQQNEKICNIFYSGMTQKGDKGSLSLEDAKSFFCDLWEGEFQNMKIHFLSNQQRKKLTLFLLTYDPLYPLTKYLNKTVINEFLSEKFPIILDILDALFADLLLKFRKLPISKWASLLKDHD